MAMVDVRISKYADLNGTLRGNLGPGDPTFYGLGPTGERRCLEQNTLCLYEPEHDYASGVIVMRDGTRMATSSDLAARVGWDDLAAMMVAKGL